LLNGLVEREPNAVGETGSPAPRHFRYLVSIPDVGGSVRDFAGHIDNGSPGARMCALPETARGHHREARFFLGLSHRGLRAALLGFHFTAGKLPRQIAFADSPPNEQHLPVPDDYCSHDGRPFVSNGPTHSALPTASSPAMPRTPVKLDDLWLLDFRHVGI
jgi:hypothetical protein